MRFSPTIFSPVLFLALAAAIHAQDLHDGPTPFRLYLSPSASSAPTTTNTPPRPPAVTGPLAVLETATTGGARQKAAADLLTSQPTLAGAVVANILQRGEPISTLLSKTILTLPADAFLAAVSAHANFPAQLDSEFLRTAALAKDDNAAIAAIALIASKHCIKNDATLDTLSAALGSGNLKRITAVLQNFDTDTEFARMPRWSSSTEETTNDRFGAGFITGSVLTGMTAPDFQPDRRRVGNHIPETQWPGLNSMFKFLSTVEAVAQTPNTAPALQNRAFEILLSESASTRLPNLLLMLLANPNSAGLAQQVALRYPTDPQLIEIVLQSLFEGKTRFDASVYFRFAPFLVREEGGRTRPLARIARRLVACSDVERRLPGLVLLAAHGAPGDISLILPPTKSAAKSDTEPSLLASPDPYVRRAAAHALARLLPEVFLIHAPTLAADVDASVRATVPFAFFKTGYRWEHRPAGGVNIGEWIVPAPNFAAPEAQLEILRKLTTDTDAYVRRNARLALLQNGRLENNDPLTDLADPATEALPTARLVQSAAAARAAKFPVPTALDTFSPLPPPQPEDPEADPALQSLPLLAVFAPPNGEVLHALDEAVSEFRILEPERRVLYYFNGTESARFALDALCRVFPLSQEQRKKPVIVFSDGAWYAADTAPDMALLRELASYESAPGAARRVELALRIAAQNRSVGGRTSEDEWWANVSQKMKKNARTNEDPFSSGDLPEGTALFYWFIGISVLGAILAVSASYLWAWYNRRPDKQAKTKSKKK